MFICFGWEIRKTFFQYTLLSDRGLDCVILFSNVFGVGFWVFIAQNEQWLYLYASDLFIWMIWRYLYWQQYHEYTKRYMINTFYIWMVWRYMYLYCLRYTEKLTYKLSSNMMLSLGKTCFICNQAYQMPMQISLLLIYRYWLNMEFQTQEESWMQNMNNCHWEVNKSCDALLLF